MLDRIDLHIEIGVADLKQSESESSAIIRERVIVARNRQLARCGMANALMNAAMVKQHCVLGKTEQAVLEQAMVQHKLSTRSYERILKVARTIADLELSDRITLSHLAEAIGLRCSGMSGTA